MRFARTRIYGILRSMLRSIGQQFADEGLLDDREDIFYLTIDEVWDFVKGTAVTTDLRGLANFRKAEYDAYRSETVPPPEDRFETYGMAYLGNSFRKRQRSDDSESDKSLAGIGCCPGIVTGTVQLVLDPASDTYFQGDILVCAADGSRLGTVFSSVFRNPRRAGKRVITLGNRGARDGNSNDRRNHGAHGAASIRSTNQDGWSDRNDRDCHRTLIAIRRARRHSFCAIVFLTSST